MLLSGACAFCEDYSVGAQHHAPWEMSQYKFILAYTVHTKQKYSHRPIIPASRCHKMSELSGSLTACQSSKFISKTSAEDSQGRVKPSHNNTSYNDIFSMIVSLMTVKFCPSSTEKGPACNEFDHAQYSYDDTATRATSHHVVTMCHIPCVCESATCLSCEIEKSRCLPFLFWEGHLPYWLTNQGCCLGLCEYIKLQIVIRIINYLQVIIVWLKRVPFTSWVYRRYMGHHGVFSASIHVLLKSRLT